MKKSCGNLVLTHVSSEIDRVVVEKTGDATVFVLHLTPLGVRRHRSFNRRWNREQASIRQANALAERRLCYELRQLEKENRRRARQTRVLIKSLIAGKVPKGRKQRCVGCGKHDSCWTYRDEHFCVKCLVLGPRKMIEVVCPRHKTWCGGRYGTCAGCFGESCGSGLL